MTTQIDTGHGFNPKRTRWKAELRERKLCFVKYLFVKEREGRDGKYVVEVFDENVRLGLANIESEHFYSLADNKLDAARILRENLYEQYKRSVLGLQKKINQDFKDIDEFITNPLNIVGNTKGYENGNG